MPSPVISFAPNGEDVVLLRALSHLAAPRYLDLCSEQALAEGWSRALDTAGWAGSHTVVAGGDTDEALAEALAVTDPAAPTETHVLWLSVPDLAPAAFRGLPRRPWVVVAASSDEPERARSDDAAEAAGYA
ncbi:MAG: hypothetical protein HGA44_08835, partial [Cellulomonadaceae bacterium]|nr:hypothetical protein [Cellulomonadaceae bacterium]